MRIRTIMPSLNGATNIFNQENINEDHSPATLVYFWSMSCSQCEQSIKNLKELAQVFNDRLTIHAIHMPREELDYMENRVKKHIQQLDILYPVYVDNELIISNRYGNRIVPAYYLFDQQQRLRFYKAGFMSTKLLQQKIARIM